jgi:fructose/tagatose bisphosphate aldolase
MSSAEIREILNKLDNSVSISASKVEIKDRARLGERVHVLAEISALESGATQSWARYLARQIAAACGIFPASIQDLYMARGRGEVPPTFTVPAINLRVLSFDAARAVIRAAKKVNAGAFIFEIARSEMGYTDQRPSEYATNVFVAAIKEGYSGPVFIQGDHFQASQKRYSNDPETEVNNLKDLISEALAAGFYNIDVDTSTLVDLSEPTIAAQQKLNTGLSAMFTSYIRSKEPEGVAVSIGGEIGEVGGHNSTEEELRAYMDGYNQELANMNPGTAGLSKISIQTGTSHGGVVLPDGSIAKVSVDFGTMLHLSQIARDAYGLAGAVQHGASTLPENMFGKFVEAQACEVHLATNFQNMLFDRLPDELRNEMYAYLDKNYAKDRKPDMTDEQFYYKMRKNAVGPFKSEVWNMPADKKTEIQAAWEDQFDKLFDLLNIADTRKYVDQTIKTVIVPPVAKDYLGEAVVEGDISDLAD